MDKPTPFLSMFFRCTAFTLLLTGCQSYHSADVYRADELGREGQVDLGVVLSVREVTVEAEDNYLGEVAGAVVGGAAGSYAVKGRGQTISAAVGAVVGGLVGSKAQQLLERRQGWEVLVRRDRDSEELVVVQLSGEPLQAGQRVQIIRLPSNRYRVVPRAPNLTPIHTPTPTPTPPT